MLLGTFVYDILVPEMSGDVSVRSSSPPQDGPCQTTVPCEPWTPRGRGGSRGSIKYHPHMAKQGPIQMAQPSTLHKGKMELSTK